MEQGAFSVCAIEGMEDKDVSKLEDKIKEVDHVKDVLWYGSISNLTLPIDVLPGEVKEELQNADSGSQLMIITFDTSMSDDDTLDAIKKIRAITDKQCLLSGMSAVVADIKIICEQEVPIYVVIAGGLSAIVLAVTMDSFLLPILFLLSIGMAIVYNLGSNFVTGEISFITTGTCSRTPVSVLQWTTRFSYGTAMKRIKEEYPGEQRIVQWHMQFHRQ